MAKIGLIAPVSHGVAKPSRRVWLAIFGHEESKVTRFRRLNALLEVGMQWNVYLNRFPMLVLGLNELNATIPRVLWAESNGVFAAACSEAQQVKSETRFGAKWVSLLILLNLRR